MFSESNISHNRDTVLDTSMQPAEAKEGKAIFVLVLSGILETEGAVIYSSPSSAQII